MQVLHILRNPPLTSHSHNSSEGSSSQALETQRKIPKEAMKVCFSALLLCRAAMAELLEEVPGSVSEPGWTHVQDKHSTTAHRFRCHSGLWGSGSSDESKTNMWLSCHRIITLLSIDIAHNMQNRILYLLLEQLVQICSGLPFSFHWVFQATCPSMVKQPLVVIQPVKPFPAGHNCFA